MNTSSYSEAERADWKLQACAGIALLLAIKFAISAAMTISQGTWLVWLDHAEATIALIAAALAVFLIMRSWGQISKEQRDEVLTGDGFVARAFRHSVVQAFFLNFLVMVFFVPMSRHWEGMLNAAFFLNFSLAFMLLVLGIGFFVRLNRGLAEPH